MRRGKGIQDTARWRSRLGYSVVAGVVIVMAGCAAKGKVDERAMAPPQTQVIEEPDLNLVKVDHPERFALVTAGRKEDVSQVRATGVVNADIDKSVPVISLASGRAVGIYAKLGDDVRKGQLLLKVQSNDISTGYQSYEQAKADEELTAKQLERAKLLYEHGAISLNDYEVAVDAERKAKVAVETSAQQLRTMGADVEHPNPIVDIYAPASGTIVEQNVVNAASVRTPDNQPNLFTIADLSTVWVICDVYENDLPVVRLGDKADVELSGYPGRVFRGRIDNIGKVMDPQIRTAKVRIVLANPGMMRAGMYVTATFYGLRGRFHAMVPSGAVLHLHDRDWVFVPVNNQEFRRTEVSAGRILDGQQEILSGIAPGAKVASDALALSAESEQ